MPPVYAVFGDDHYLIRESIAAVARAVFPEEDDDAGDHAVRRAAGHAGRRAGRAVHAPVLQPPPAGHRRGGRHVRDEASQGPRGLCRQPELVGDPAAQVKQWTATTNLAKLVEKVGLAIDCNALPEKQAAEGRLLADPVRPHAMRRRSSTPAAANLLVELVGLEIGILASEVEKLAVYAGDSKRIERADVARMVGAGRVETIWKALDAATTGQAGSALELLDNLLAAGEAPVMLLAAMSASLLKVHHAGRLRRARLPLDEACRIAGIPPSPSTKTGKQHAHLGPRRVDQLPATLLRADLDLKGGSSADPRVVLERLLVGLSRPRTD